MIEQQHWNTYEQLVKDKPIDYSNYNNGKRFSYLEQLSIEKQEAVNEFMTSKKIEYLSDFSPEEMVIVYLHLVSISDSYLIYAITYNGGILPDYVTYLDEYNERSVEHSEMVVHYRHFDSIKIHEKTDENSVTVNITVGVHIHTHSMVIGLQKEDDIWKLDIYHLIKQEKEKITAN